MGRVIRWMRRVLIGVLFFAIGVIMASLLGEETAVTMSFWVWIILALVLVVGVVATRILGRLRSNR